ncbi:hypothetical protein [Rufibacter immobilis]|uniref:hypothetical protein n=1 Tax=Rufibacter immobilis TaxID=1348778 RepID=UPI0035EBFCD1
MKNSVFFLAAGLLLTGCAHTENLGTTEQQEVTALGMALSLPLQKPVAVQDMTLQLLKVEDSRCPMNAMCIRQGSAVTHVQVKDQKGNEATKILYLGDALTVPEDRGIRSADTVQVLLGGKPYQLILTEVQPYPNTSDARPAPKTAKVSIAAL